MKIADELVYLASVIKTQELIVRKRVLETTPSLLLNDDIMVQLVFEIRKELVSPDLAAERLIGIAEILLAQFEARDDSEFINWCQTVHSKVDPNNPIADKNAKEEAAKVNIELLTSVWLALYFLGIPFSHPWEQVLIWVENESGGLPNGVCVAKAIGDIVRNARIKYVSSRNNNDQLLAISYLPLLLFRDLVTGGERLGCTPVEAHRLGRLYEILQFKLFALKSCPVVYLIPESILVKRLGLQAGMDQTALRRSRSEWDDALLWLQKTMLPNATEYQKVFVVSDIPFQACFINYESGLYTFEKVSADNEIDLEIPLPAGYMREIRRKLYQHRLSSFRPNAPEENLLSRDLNGKLFDSLLKKCEGQISA